ncbi:MAG TPA: YihY/virulence factor BrkB family protein [Acidobacteriaceae bacterium]|nr:YihY/virulence factor BrkB family protein [Acidobacteriaceae bacterium]
MQRTTLFSGPDGAQGGDARAPAVVHAEGRRGRSWTWSRWRHRVRRRWRETRCLLKILLKELARTQVLDVAAGLAFWSMLSMVPLLITVASLMSVLRIPSLLPQLLSVLAMLVPSDALSTVEKMIGSLLQPHRGVLSFGILSYIWSTTGGFTALITALNVAYDVATPRSWVRDRLQALVLALTSGGLLTVSLLALIAGPHFGHFLAEVLPMPRSFERTWPVIRIATVFVTFVVGLELVYFLGPNRKQQFKSTLPGAIVAIALWFVGSAGLAFYLDHLAHYSRLYGGMGAIIGLMFWIYLTALAILIGAELNAELAKRRDSLFRAHLKEAERERMAAEKGLLRKRPAA